MNFSAKCVLAGRKLGEDDEGMGFTCISPSVLAWGVGWPNPKPAGVCIAGVAKLLVIGVGVAGVV